MSEEHTELNALLNLEHGETLAKILFKSWMDEHYKNEFLQIFLEDSGATMEILNSDIQIGINNGYSPEEQIRLFKDKAIG